MPRKEKSAKFYVSIQTNPLFKSGCTTVRVDNIPEVRDLLAENAEMFAIYISTVIEKTKQTRGLPPFEILVKKEKYQEILSKICKKLQRKTPKEFSDSINLFLLGYNVTIISIKLEEGIFDEGRTK